MFFTVLVATVMICVAFVIINLMIDKKIVYKSLKRRHVVITGGSSGIGKAAAIESAKLGAHVTIIGRDVNRLQLAVKEISEQCLDKESQIIHYTVLDVTADYKTIENSLSSLEAKVGPIFMLVNCAGMCICGQFEKMDVEDIKKMVDLNYFGTAYPTKYVLPGMKARDEGILVFVSSEAAFLGIYGYSAYTAGKWAVRGLAEAVNMELIGKNVRLMLAFPPDTDTPGFKNEDLTKPPETKLISGSGGLHSPEAVGKQMIHDALVGKTYSVYSLTGNLLTTLCSLSIESAQQVIVQVLSMGLLRIVMVAILFSFHKIVKDGLKMKNEKQGQKIK